MYEVMAILRQHAGNLEYFSIQKHAEECAAQLCARGIPCLIRKIEDRRQDDHRATGAIIGGGRGALAETARRAVRGEIVTSSWMQEPAPGLGLYAGKWLARP